MRLTLPPSHRTLAAALAAQLLLGACAANAHSPEPHVVPFPPPAPFPSPWPEPRQPVVRVTPNFQAPSAPHCARPVVTREIPGAQPGAQQRWPGDELRMRERRRDGPARSGGGVAADAIAPSAPGIRGAPAEPPPTAAAAAPEAKARVAPPALQRRESAGIEPQSQQLPSPSEVVTAGVVDDNGDFSAYLQFLRRTSVHHRPRDVRERYLLEVKDSRGRGVVDAEVAVQAANGHAMWARTDAGGRVWLHPNAFDPSRSHEYSVAVRKDGRQAGGRLTRGQRSAVEVVLDTPAEAGRARLDLVFLVDATGSMGDEIDKLKATLRTITSEVAGLPSQPDICLGLVAYRDQGDAFLVRSHDFTNDVGGFLRDALLPLHANGGGDYPEAMNEALHETVHHLSWRGNGATRLVVLLADAPPHLDYGGPQYDESMVAALGKGIKVFSVGASGLDRQGEFIQRQIAQYTGGRFVFLTYANARHPSSGPGRETVHDVRNYSVETLDRLIVRLVSEELARRGGTGG
jgi:Mg-chelatase subunit ChlD